MGRKVKLSRDDWIAAASDWVAANGVATLAVEPLARALGVTKGGFYWCFANRDELLQAVLERWEAQGMQNIIHLIEQQPDAAAQARELIRLVARSIEPQAQGLSQAVRMQYALWSAAHDPLVAPVIERVTAARVRFLAQVLQQAGLAADVAEHRATLGYASYVGLALLRVTQVGDDVAGVGRDGLIDAYITMLLAPPPPAVPPPAKHRTGRAGRTPK